MKTRNTLVAFAVTGLLSAASTAFALPGGQSAAGNGNGNGGDRVEVCHLDAEGNLVLLNLPLTASLRLIENNPDDDFFPVVPGSCEIPEPNPCGFSAEQQALLNSLVGPLPLAEGTTERFESLFTVLGSHSTCAITPINPVSSYTYPLGTYLGDVMSTEIVDVQDIVLEFGLFNGPNLAEGYISLVTNSLTPNGGVFQTAPILEVTEFGLLPDNILSETDLFGAPNPTGPFTVEQILACAIAYGCEGSIVDELTRN